VIDLFIPSNPLDLPSLPYKEPPITSLSCILTKLSGSIPFHSLSVVALGKVELGDRESSGAG
jgi:hypothetical protein